MGRFPVTAAALAAAMIFGAYGANRVEAKPAHPQTETRQETNGQKAKDDAKEAGHDTKNAAKSAGRAVKHGTKKGVHEGAKGVDKGAQKTQEGIGKVERKTDDDSH